MAKATIVVIFIAFKEADSR